jgi:virulence-associated protein VapD
MASPCFSRSQGSVYVNNKKRKKKKKENGEVMAQM